MSCFRAGLGDQNYDAVMHILNTGDLIPVIDQFSGFARAIIGAGEIGVAIITQENIKQSEGYTNVLRGLTVMNLTWFSVTGIIFRVGLFFYDNCLSEEGKLNREAAGKTKDQIVSFVGNVYSKVAALKGSPDNQPLVEPVD